MATKRRELGRLGAVVSEPYLDETGDRLGRTLMTKCRARSLPVMEEMKLPAAKGICLMCPHWPGRNCGALTGHMYSVREGKNEDGDQSAGDARYTRHN